MTVAERYSAPTPKFFKRISRTGKILIGIGGGLAALATTVFAGPIAGVAVGKILLTAGGVLGTIGTTAVAVAQATVDEHAPTF